MSNWAVVECDAKEALPAFARAVEGEQVVFITDPPYGIDHSTGVDQDKRVSGRFRKVQWIAGDGGLEDFTAVYEFCKANTITLAAFYSPYNPPPVEWKSILVWHKCGRTGPSGPGNYRWKRDFEMIGVQSYAKLNGQWDSAIVTCRAVMPEYSKTGHFCEKPLPLMRYLIKKLSNEGDLIVDPFCGSGSTGVAALELGRRFLGFEVDPKWVPVAEKRLAQTKRIRGFL